MRVGNAASEQMQLDVYGEIIDAFTTARTHGLEASDHAWRLSVNLLEFLEEAWRKPDAGIWEVRGPSRHFTHSKVMAWVAFDRGDLHERDAGVATGRSSGGGRSATRSTPTSAPTASTRGWARSSSRTARSGSTRASC